MNLLDLYEGREPYQQAIDKLEQARIDHLKEKMDYYAKHGMAKEFMKAKEEHDGYHKVQNEMGYGGLTHEDQSGIGHDIVNKTEKMARATPPTKAGAVASTVKNAAKWLAGKGGPGREGPTYESQGGDVTWKELDRVTRLERLRDLAKRQGDHKKFARLDAEIKDIYSKPTTEGAEDIADRGEYDQEGDMAKDNIHTIVRNAKELESILGDDDNLPEWVQDKLANIKGMMTAVSEYMQTQHERDHEEATGEEGITFAESQKKNSKLPLNQRLNRLKVQARREFPQVDSDEEALLLKLLDKETQDDRINRQVDTRQDAEIKRNFTLDRDQEDEIRDLQTQLDIKEHGGGIGPKQRWQDLMPEGWQDFNKVEPYEVCLAGKPVKTFDYYEDARRFHDNWKKKLYREGNKAKADKITLNPVMKEGVSDKTLKQLQGLFKQAKAGKLKSDGMDFTKGDHWTGPDYDDPSYAKNFGHGYADTPSTRKYDRYVNKRLKKDDKKKQVKEFAPTPERDDDDIPDQIVKLANRWWNAAGDQPKIENVLRSLGWSIHQVESEDDAVQLMHNDGTTYFISADDFDPEVFEDQEDDWYDDEEESDLQNGSYVVDTQDPSGEVYRVSQYEPGARRCWIGDRDGRGWYISPDRLEIVADPDRIRRYFGKRVEEEKTRLDPKCWKGKKIGNPKTKMKGGVRVNNCVPAESVNENQDTSGVESAIIRRIMVAHTDWLQKFGPEKVMQAAEEVAYNVGDVDEIGTSDVSAYVHEVGQILGAV